MAMHECEAYWQDFLRRPKEQRAIREEQRRLQKEAADRLAALKTAKMKEVEDALIRCTPDQQRLIRPLLKAPGLLELLHDCLLRSDRDPSIFSKRIETEQPLASRILEKAAEYEQDPEAFERMEERTHELHEEAARPVDMADLDYLKQRTWKDLPQAELAERMSKGEICPREEWIPALEEHLAFGERLAREGREAYAASDYGTAFMRFKQGVELVNWVEAKDAVRQRCVDDMYCMFLRNVAQAALKLEKYQEAIRACTTIIQQLDEHDSKARYRRGRAYLLLGMAKCAKDDFLFILKSPYSTNEGVHAARLGLRELRRVVSRSETETKATVRKGLSGELFSKGRLTEEEAIRATFSADTNSDEEEYRAEDDEEDFRLPPLQKFSGSTASMESSRFGDTQRPPLNLDETRDLLLDLLDAYTSEPVASQLNELRSLADLDYRRVVIRARKFLPQIQAPIFARHGLQGESHRSQMKVLEKSVAFWRFQDPEIADLTRDCLDAIFGDVADIDI
ncbi:hypothetical protein Emag_004177 [Eimeria magna]